MSDSMKKYKKSLLWFRKDLRIHYHYALSACLERSHTVGFVYCYHQDLFHIGSAQKWWLHHSLCALDQQLQSLFQVSLSLFAGDHLEILCRLVQTEGIDAIFISTLYELDVMQSDKKLKARLAALGCDLIYESGHLLIEPWTLLNDQGASMKVFTPFWKRAQRQIVPRMPPDISPKQTSFFTPQCSFKLRLSDLNLCPTEPNWAIHFDTYWTPGEQGARVRWATFLENGIRGYKEMRNRPDYPASTSRLSPHLALGEISPYELWNDCMMYMQDNIHYQEDVQHFLSELGWREFSYYLLYHHPSLEKHNFKQIFNHFEWNENPHFFRAWKKGLTGIPIIDAAMRELWISGYMHNRTRMIVASFLTKHMLIDWRKGAAYFLDTLVDADRANNSGSWQWVAGSGSDAAPYFRVFNPILQGKKFDPEGVYVKTWLPELRSIPVEYIHEPSACIEGRDLINQGLYLKPILDLAACRDEALKRYSRLRS